MKTTTSSVNFAGVKIYVGLDVHHKSWKVHIYSDEFELQSMSRDVSVETLYEYLQKHYKGADYELAYEAGFSGYWIQRVPCSQGAK